jgi:hypothetical protein
MSSSNLIRWSGLAALVGGALFIVFDIVEFLLIGNLPYAEAATSSSWMFIEVGFILAAVLIGLGLVGLYARQIQETGSLGLIAFVVTFAGAMMAVGIIWSEAFFGGWLANAAPQLLEAEPSGTLGTGIVFSYFLFALGWLLFGLASLRARVHPLGATWLMIVGALLFIIISMLEVPFESIVLGAALAWMGYAQWSGTGEAVLMAETAR